MGRQERARRFAEVSRRRGKLTVVKNHEGSSSSRQVTKKGEGTGGKGRDPQSEMMMRREILCFVLLLCLPQKSPLTAVATDEVADSMSGNSVEANEEEQQLSAADRFRETFSFLRDTADAKRKFRVHFVRLRGEGNYTGELGKERKRHGWGEMVWDGSGEHDEGDRYVGQWRDDKQHGKTRQRQCQNIGIKSRLLVHIKVTQQWCDHSSAK